MTHVTLYHNPRCSKSRQALSLLQDQGVEIDVRHYLDKVPTAAELTQLVKQLGLTSAHAMLRTKEIEYQQAELSPSSSDETIINAITTYPKLLERPIAVVDNKAIIGRPAENVLELL